MDKPMGRLPLTRMCFNDTESGAAVRYPAEDSWTLSYLALSGLEGREYYVQRII
jgi:hypothetical protein